MPTEQCSEWRGAHSNALPCKGERIARSQPTILGVSFINSGAALFFVKHIKTKIFLSLWLFVSSLRPHITGYYSMHLSRRVPFELKKCERQKRIRKKKQRKCWSRLENEFITFKWSSCRFACDITLLPDPVQPFLSRWLWLFHTLTHYTQPAIYRWNEHSIIYILVLGKDIGACFNSMKEEAP